MKTTKKDKSELKPLGKTGTCELCGRHNAELHVLVLPDWMGWGGHVMSAASRCRCAICGRFSRLRDIRSRRNRGEWNESYETGRDREIQLRGVRM